MNLPKLPRENIIGDIQQKAALSITVMVLLVAYMNKLFNSSDVEKAQLASISFYYLISFYLFFYVIFFLTKRYKETERFIHINWVLDATFFLIALYLCISVPSNILFKAIVWTLNNYPLLGSFFYKTFMTIFVTSMILIIWNPIHMIILCITKNGFFWDKVLNRRRL